MSPDKNVRESCREKSPGKFSYGRPGQRALESLTTPLLHQRLFATYHFLAYEGKYSSSDLTCKYHQQASKELQRKETISHECSLFMGAASQPLVLPRPQQPTLNQSSYGGSAQGCQSRFLVTSKQRGNGKDVSQRELQENQRVIPGNTSQGTSKGVSARMPALQ